ncbi:hypothetical protein R1sor_023179 [Riccia sorocarpa]|uniref:Succinate dehydrogenase subunit 4 n=1 Tax=Riccia sorocarpa TaxID=122646 RepID=A0ABD3GLX2_9MARC
MAMAISCCRASNAALPLLGLQLPHRRMSRTRNSLSSRSFLEFEVIRNASLRSSCFVKAVRAPIRGAVAGEGEEVEDSDRPGTVSSKKRSKTMSSSIENPSSPSSDTHATGSKEKVRSSNLISAFMDDMAGFMAPREKGDIRDLVLMSFSFALFIYISQHLVHAYCALSYEGTICLITVNAVIWDIVYMITLQG